MLKMQRRTGFGLVARGFAMTVSLQEGYKGGKIHTVEEVEELLKHFACDFDVEFGCEIVPTKVFYSFRSDGQMELHLEPAVKLVGLFPPNKFGHYTDEQLAELIGKLAGYLAAPLGQTSFHAEVCGHHYAWKQAGQMTAHELALAKAAGGEAELETSREELLQALAQEGLANSPDIMAALALADEGHLNQERLGGGSTLEQHIYPVTLLTLSESKGLPEAVRERRVCMALCHDLREDAGFSDKRIREALGDDIADGVELITDTDKTPEAYYTAIGSSEDVSSVKLSDRRCNLQTAHRCPDKKDIEWLIEDTTTFVFRLIPSGRSDIENEISKRVVRLEALLRA